MPDTEINARIQYPEICPITGLPVLQRPEWTDVYFGDNYRLTFRVLGRRILLAHFNEEEGVLDKEE